MKYVLALTIALSLAGCRDRKIERLEWPAMGTVAAVQLRGGDIDSMRHLAAEVKGAFSEVERLLSAYDPKSELSRLARLDDDEILRRCTASVRPCYKAAFRLRDETGGRFDPRWKGPGTMDLGAIAKGLAVDLAYERVKNSGLEALIDLGGNLRVVNGQWRTLVATSDETLELTGGMACATSAEYFRGQHIRDAKSSSTPAGTGCSVTVVHPSSAMLADALSTAAFILGREQARELFRRLYPSARIVWVP